MIFVSRICEEYTNTWSKIFEKHGKKTQRFRQDHLERNPSGEPSLVSVVRVEFGLVLLG